MTDAPAAAHESRGAQVARSGGCLCGGVQFGLDGPPLWVAHCHCSMCRRAQGAGFVTWAGFAEDALRIEAGEDLLSRYSSSPAAVRSFCRRCGSPLFFRSARWPGEIHVTLASLDSTEDLRPAAHAYWSSRAPWLGWDGGDLARVEPDGEAR